MMALCLKVVVAGLAVVWVLRGYELWCRGWHNGQIGRDD